LKAEAGGGIERRRSTFDRRKERKGYGGRKRGDFRKGKNLKRGRHLTGTRVNKNEKTGPKRKNHQGNVPCNHIKGGKKPMVGDAEQKKKPAARRILSTPCGDVAKGG